MMNAPPAGRTCVILAAAFIFANLVVLSVLTPALPAAGLDPSWSMVLGYAFEKGWQFGTDIVFTYGPLGFIAANQYVPGLEILSLLYWLALHGLIAAALCVLYRGAHWPALIFLAVISFILAPVTSRDGYVFAAMLLLYLTARQSGRAAFGVALALTVLMAAAGVMKTTYLAAAPVFVVLADVERWRRWQRAPVLTPLFVIVAFGCYLAAGQSLSALGEYLLSAWDIATGYNGAMQTPGDPFAYALYGILSGILLAALVLTEGKGALIPVLACAVCLFFAGKAGFVRQDAGHMVIAWTALVLAALSLLGPASTGPGGKSRAIVTLELAFVAAIGLVFAALPLAPGAPVSAFTGQAAAAASLAKRQVAALASPRADFAALYNERLAAIRNEDPLPALSGSVDVIPTDQAAVIAAGLDYHPRPVFQSYSAYTPRLIAKNRAFFEAASAPDHLLLKVASLDGRFPSLDDGAVWPEILRRYESAGLHGDYLLLNRRAAPRDVTLAPLLERSIGFDEAIDLAPWRGSLLWVALDIRPSIWGVLEGALLRPPPAYITVTANGMPRAFRIVPGMAGEGFLLSPLIESAAQFGGLPAAETFLDSLAVTVRPADRGSFQGAIQVRIMRLDVGP